MTKDQTWMAKALSTSSGWLLCFCITDSFIRSTNEATVSFWSFVSCTHWVRVSTACMEWRGRKWIDPHRMSGEFNLKINKEIDHNEKGIGLLKLHRRWLCAFEGSPPWRGNKRTAAGLFRPAPDSPDSPPTGCVWCALIWRAAAAADAGKTDAAATRSCCWPWCWAALNLEAVGKAFLNSL